MYVSFKIDQTRMPSGLVIIPYQLEVTAVTSLQKTEGQRLWALQRQLVSI
jgi:hypothetical protein